MAPGGRSQSKISSSRKLGKIGPLLCFWFWPHYLIFRKKKTVANLSFQSLELRFEAKHPFAVYRPWLEYVQ